MTSRRGLRRALRGGLAAGLVVAVAACGGDDGDGSDGGAGGGRATAAVNGTAGPVLLAEPDGEGMVAVSPDGEERRPIEGAPSMASGGQGVFPFGVPGTAVMSDEGGALFLVRASEGRAVDLEVTLAGGGSAVVGPSGALGGGARFAVATSVNGGDPVLVDAEAATATDLAGLGDIPDDELLFQNLFSRDERHLAVSTRDGVHLVATEDAADLGPVGDRIGAFTTNGDSLYVTRGGDGGEEEAVRVAVDDAGPGAGEVVATGEPLRVIAAFADTALALDGEDLDLVIVGDGDPSPVDVVGAFGGGGLNGSEAALLRLDGSGDGDSWARVDASGEAEALPELDGFVPVGGRRDTLVLADGDPSDAIGALAVARVEDGGIEVAAAPVDVPADAATNRAFVPSPDGRQVAGTWFLEDGAETFVVDVAGDGALRRIEGVFVAWSPAGDDVLVGRTTGTGPAATAVVVAPDDSETNLGEGRPLAWTAG